MIGLIFQYGAEIVETRIEGTSLWFRTSTFGSNFVPIDSLHFSKEGVIKEHPDLEGDPLWKAKAIERFKAEMRKMGNEHKIAEYVISDLKKYGYVATYRQVAGHRLEKLK